jgi:hypothetical protein
MLDAHCEESSTDDIDNVNSDNYVIFVGDNIIIGRSNLRKENTSTPRKVSFIIYSILFSIIFTLLFILMNYINFIIYVFEGYLTSLLIILIII